jgi:trk system potassium uptake protein TrkA
MAKTLGIKEVFCISNEPKHDMVLYSIGINHVINPRMHIAREILETIMSGEIMATFSLRNANLEVMRLHAEAGSKVTSGRLMDIWSKFHAEAIIGAIIHEDNMVIPRGETRICAGDQVIILFKIGGRDKISPLFKQPEGLVEKVKNLLPKG